MKTEWVRDGKQKILGTKTEFTQTGITVARDREGHILGYSSEEFKTTRDSRGRLVRTGEANTDCLFEK